MIFLNGCLHLLVRNGKGFLRLLFLRLFIGCIAYNFINCFCLFTLRPVARGGGIYFINNALRNGSGFLTVNRNVKLCIGLFFLVFFFGSSSGPIGSSGTSIASLLILRCSSLSSTTGLTFS
jgi:hypothetical protein